MRVEKKISKNSRNGIVHLVFFLPGTLPPEDLELEEAFQASVSGRLEDVGSWTLLAASR